MVLKPLLRAGIRAERAGSIGWVSAWPRGQKIFSFGGGGGSCPPHMRRTKRLMIPSVTLWPPAPGIPWPLQHTFFQRAKLLQRLKIRNKSKIQMFKFLKQKLCFEFRTFEFVSSCGFRASDLEFFPLLYVLCALCGKCLLILFNNRGHPAKQLIWVNGLGNKIFGLDIHPAGLGILGAAEMLPHPC